MPYEIKETLITIKDIGLTFGDKVILNWPMLFFEIYKKDED